MRKKEFLTSVRYAYRLTKTGANTATCTPAGSDADCVGDNWTPKNSTTGVTDSDWTDYYHAEYRGFNAVYITSPTGDQIADYYFSTKGWATVNSDASNYNAGHVYEEDFYGSNRQLYRQTLNEYTGNCGQLGCPTINSCNGNYNTTYSPCEVMVIWSQTIQWDQTFSTSAPNVQTTSTYDDYTPTGGLLPAGYHNLLQQVIQPSNAPQVTKKWAFASVDTTVGTWVYYDVNKAVQSETDDTSGHRWQCQSTTYDEGAPTGMSAGWPTTVKTYQSSNCGNSGATPLATEYIGYDAYGNVVAKVDGVGAANSGLYSSGGCSASPVIKAAAWTSGHYTSCTTYDSYEAQPLTSTGAATGTINLSGSVSYDSTQGRLPISTTDANGQTTTTAYSYDSTGNTTVSISQPGEIAAYTSQSSTNSQCSTTLLFFPTELSCYEVDSKSSLYANAISQTFYDSLGRAVETSTPIVPPVGADTSQYYFQVVLSEYRDDTTHSTWQSVPFVVVGTTAVGSGTGVGYLDPASAQDYLGNSPRGTATYFDPLGRPLAVQDPAFDPSNGVPGMYCASFGGNATTCATYSISALSTDTTQTSYVTTQAIDANDHLTTSYSDVFGHSHYVQLFSGVASGTLTPNEQVATLYNVLSEPTSVTTTDQASPSGSSQTVTASATYDDLGRVLTVSDPDRGNHTYTYDANGKVLTDTSGMRVLGYNYDLGGRLGCEQSGTPTINASGACTSGTQALVQNFYDSSHLTISGTTDYPLGRLTKSIATTVYHDGTQATSTTLAEYDQRGRTLAQQLQIGVPSTWGVTTALPTYQTTLSYNDANQLVTSQPSVGGVTAPSTTQVYDPATGVQIGLSNNTNTVTANLATLGYNNNALPGTLTFLSNTGSAIASEQFSYDNDLRTISGSACWTSLGCGGTNGTIFSQSVAYDPAGNVLSSTTNYAPVNGVSSSGGSQTQDFCYDEQNRLVWAGNSGSVPSAGNGTCGSATLQNSLSGTSATYSNSFVYTHLGQLYQAPINGGTTQDQYLYCDSTHPHRLTGLYTLGTTCATKGTSNRVYTSTYDAWGNVTSRFFGNATTTLSYDALDHFTEWNKSSSNHEWYVYDASGTRVLRRSINGSSTTLTTYAFGDDHTYSSTGATTTGNTYYFTLAGRLIGEESGTSSLTMQYSLQDLLGSPLAVFSNASGTTTVLGSRAYGPYGNQLSQSGSMGTAKGFTDQYNDSLTGLDYYGARYYDQKVGVFLSADSVQGNMQGMNPYGYVGGNPETRTDPTGLRPVSGDPADPGSLGVPWYFQYPSSSTPSMPSFYGGGGTGTGSGSAGGTSAGGTSAGGSGSSSPIIMYGEPVGGSGGSGSGGSSSGSGGSSSGNGAASGIMNGGTSSCGVQYGQGSACGNFGVHYVAYTPTGIGIGIPGEWCVVCGSGGAGRDSGDEPHQVGIDFASDERGSQSTGTEGAPSESITFELEHIVAYDSKGNPVHFLANVEVSGDTITVKNIAVYGVGEGKVQGVGKQIVSALMNMRQWAADLRFKDLFVEDTYRGLTSSSANPGKNIVRHIDLTRFWQ